MARRCALGFFVGTGFATVAIDHTLGYVPRLVAVQLAIAIGALLALTFGEGGR